MSPIKPYKYVDICESQSSGSLCDLKIGRARVDCCFLMSKTQWGELDGKDSGLMYLNMTFHQPSEYKLANATITMNFHDANNAPIFFPGLEITDYFGPRALSGEKTERQVSKKFEVNPKIGAASVNAEGIGVSATSDASVASRWKFTGRRLEADSARNRPVHASQYRKLVWHLEENNLERQSVRHPTVHTALAFHHDFREFYLDLQIQIKMQRWHHRFKQNLIYPPRDRKASTRTKMKPKPAMNAQFQRLARTIDQAMTRANLHPVAEVPGPQPASSINDTDWEKDGYAGPSEALIALAKQLTGQENPISSAAVKTSPVISTHTTESPSPTLVEKDARNDIIGSGERIETTSSMIDASDSRPPIPVEELAINSAALETLFRLILAFVKGTSRFLAILVAVLIMGLGHIQSFLARSGR